MAFNRWVQEALNARADLEDSLARMEEQDERAKLLQGRSGRG